MNRLIGDDLCGILCTDLSGHLPIFAIKWDKTLKEKMTIVKRRQSTPENKAMMIDKLNKESWTEIYTLDDQNES